MMNLLLDFALAALERVASARARRDVLTRAGLVVAGAAIATAGVGFLIAASYIALADLYGAAAAAALVGAGLAVLGTALILVRRRRKPVRIGAIAPAAMVAVAPGARGPEMIFLEFNRILDARGPLAAAFFFVGVSAGLVSRWILVRRG